MYTRRFKTIISTIFILTLYALGGYWVYTQYQDPLEYQVTDVSNRSESWPDRMDYEDYWRQFPDKGK